MCVIIWKFEENLVKYVVVHKNNVSSKFKLHLLREIVEESNSEKATKIRKISHLICFWLSERQVNLDMYIVIFYEKKKEILKSVELEGHRLQLFLKSLTYRHLSSLMLGPNLLASVKSTHSTIFSLFSEPRTFSWTWNLFNL